MAGLKEVRETLALRGHLEARQISQLLNMSDARVTALLAHLEHMGLAARVTPEPDSQCVAVGCRRCPQRAGCQPELWTLLQP